MNALRGLWGIARAALHVLRGLRTIHRDFHRIGPLERAAHIQAWSLAFLRILNVRLDVCGEPCREGGVLIVSNHISWLDIMVMLAARPARFVSKYEVRAWPVVGKLVTGAGTLYIERERKRDAMRVVHDVAAALKAGDVIAFFPEGTTSSGHTVLPFHANLLQAAISAEARVQPVGLNYWNIVAGQVDRSQPSRVAAYIDDDVLVPSVWRLLCSPGVLAELHFGVPLEVRAANRRDLAAAMSEAVVRLRQAR